MMDRNMRELLLVEVRISTSSGKAIFCLSSTFRRTTLLFKYIICNTFKESTYAYMCTNTCTYNDSCTEPFLFIDPKYVNYGGGKREGLPPFPYLVLKLKIG